MAVRADSEEVIGRKGERGVFIIPTKQAILVAEVCPLPIFLHLCSNREDDARREMTLTDSTMPLSELEMPMSSSPNSPITSRASTTRPVE
jgi:hypothetical protein